jgi:chromosome segregation ATPase
MEIARLTAICRKSDCGPLENDIVRLRQQIATLEKRNADLEEGRDNFEPMMTSMWKQLACKDAELEAAEKERADLEATLEKEKADLEKEESDLEESDLEAEILELKLEHKLDYKKLDDLNNHLLEERLQQDKRIIDLEYQIQLVKDDLAYGPMEGSVAGAGDDLSAEEQAYQQAQRQHSS